ncbi:hypothetical protein ACJJTC_000719 [Scirpophaga incertulas]
MNTILVLAAALGAATADVGLGYQYKVPQTSYGVPTYPIGTIPGSAYNTGYADVGGSNGYKNQPTYQGGYTGLQSGVGNTIGFQTVNTRTGNQYSGTSNVTPTTLVQPNYSGNIAQTGYQTFNQYQTSYQQKHQHQYQYQYQQQPEQVYKHFYVHAAPEETEQQRPRNPVALPAPQKHYKIIFIKTPTEYGGTTQYVQVQPQTEEKTIVYVLVNKPEITQDVAIPKLETKLPSKPEVYFVKYNSKEDSQAVINNIVNDFNNKGEPSSFTNSNAEVTEGEYPARTPVAATAHYPVQAFEESGALSSGTYSEQANVESGPVANVQTESQLLANFGTPFGHPQHSHIEKTASGSISGTQSVASGESTSSGYESSAPSIGSSSHSSSNVDFENLNLIATSQGVPHETYGIPNFKV